MSQKKRFGLPADSSALAAELSELARQNVVNLARGPRERTGILVGLFLMPRPQDQSRLAGLEIQIVPLAPLADVEDDVLAGMRDAAEELLGDTNPDVRESAAESLKRLGLPRLAAHDLEGHLFHLNSATNRGARMTQATDCRGKARFEKLAETEFHLEYGGRHPNTAGKGRP